MVRIMEVVCIYLVKYVGTAGGSRTFRETMITFV